MPEAVWRATTIVAEPEISVMDWPLARRVEPEMMYCDCAFGVMVSVPMVRAADLEIPKMEVLEP